MTMLEQEDFGAGTNTTYTIPANTNRLVVYLNGPGAGGGGGNSNSAGGGGGSGAKGMFVFTGTLGGKDLDIVLPVGGTGGAPGQNGNIASGHATVAFDNSFTLIAGSGSLGYGGNGQPGPGGRGGNIATNTPDQGGGAVLPSYVTSFGQFNLGAPAGMDGTQRLYGHGGNEGDTGGGGKGGWWNTAGENGQGGYIHIECYED